MSDEYIHISMPDSVDKILSELSEIEEKPHAEILKERMFKALAPDFIVMRIKDIGSELKKIDMTEIDKAEMILVNALIDISKHRKRIDEFIEYNLHVRDDVDEMIQDINNYVDRIKKEKNAKT